MRIVSFNCNGYRSFTHEIFQHASVLSNTGKLTFSNAIKYWMEKHGIDILCLQEVKLTDSTFEQDAVEGLDMFWNICKGTFYPPTLNSSSSGESSSKKQKSTRGMNGVATFAKQGLTIGAKSSVLKVEDLDKEGRCICTEHKDFVLFNVYVHNDGPLARSVSTKMSFLIRLRLAMKEAAQRTNKPIILVGDLNFVHRIQDTCWEDAKIHIPTLLSVDPESDPELGEWIRDVQKYYPEIERCLRSLEFVESEPNSSRYRVMLSRPGEDKKIRLNVDGLWDKEECDASFHMNQILQPFHDMSQEVIDFVQGQTYYDEDVVSQDDSGNLHWIIRAKGILSLYDLFLIMSIGLGLPNWTRAAMNEMIDNPRNWIRSRNRPPIGLWLKRIITEDNMVDTLLQIHKPLQPKFRYTCWDMYTNRRYTNQGSRIDFILMSESLACERLVPFMPSSEDDRNSIRDPKAALADVTVNGLLKPASFDGGGIPDTSRLAYNFQFSRSLLGMIYTPPRFSDHIPVSCTLTDTDFSRQTLCTDKDTKACMLQAKQKKISSYFAAKPTS